MFHVHLKIMHLLLLWGEMLWRYQLNPVDLVCPLRPLSPCWFSAWKIYLLRLMGIKIPYCDCISVNISLNVHQDLLYIFRCSYVGCVSVYWAYILFLDCFLYHFVMSFFVSYCSLGFKVYFVGYDSSPFVSLKFVWNIFFHPFTFSLCVSFYLRWVSWRDHI